MKKILFLFFIFFTSISKSQIIKGTINDSHGNKISLANIFFKKEKKSNEFEEFTVAKNGYFEHTLKKKYDSIYISIQTFGFEEEIFKLIKFDDKIINLKFELIKSTNVLDEVTVVASKKKLFIIKNDTVNFNVKGYADGSEQKIE